MSKAEQTYDLSLLDRSYAKWQVSPALRLVYADIFSAIRQHLVAGRVLEIGSGIGVSRDFIPGLVTSDIAVTRFVDRAISAYDIPRENWGNVIALDMLHHLQEPLRFLASAAAALAPGGRVVLVEPAGTLGGRLFYRCFHHEPCVPDLIRPPFRFAADADGSFANMGMAYALFVREHRECSAFLQSQGLRLVEIRYRDLLAYPATGGFSGSAFLPPACLRGLLAIERWIPQFLLRVLALRMIVVLEKT